MLKNPVFLVLFLVAACTLAGAATAQTSRVLWRVRLPGQYLKAPPRVGPSGRVYAVTLDGTLHAITASGSVAWTRAGAGEDGLAVGPDETIYTGDNDRVEATSATGRRLWVFSISPRAFIFQGLAVGPDGNVYVLTASTSLGGPGIFSLTPSGRLRWSTAEPYSRPIVNHQDLVFGRTPDRRGWQFVFSANGHLARVELQTGRRTIIPQGTRAQPAVAADDKILCGTVAYDAGGALLWRSNSSLVAAASSSDVYATRGNVQRLRATDGSTVWTYSDGRYPSLVAESPDGRLIVFASSANSSTKSNSVMAVDDSGGLLWSQFLPIENGNRLTQYAPAVFTSDGARAYVSVATIGASRPFNSYVYAIDIRGPKAPRVWSYGLACRTPASRPQIQSTGVPRLGSMVSVELTGAPARGPAFLLVGSRSQVVRLDDAGGSGCRSYPQLEAIIARQASASGTASVAVPIPNAPALVGLRVLFQWAVVEPPSSAFATTQGLGMLVGR